MELKWIRVQNTCYTTATLFGWHICLDSVQTEFLVIHYRKGKKCPVWLSGPPNNEHNDTYQSLHSAQTTKWEIGRKKKHRRKKKWELEKPVVIVCYSDCSTSPYKPVRTSQHNGIKKSWEIGQMRHFFFSFFFLFSSEQHEHDFSLPVTVHTKEKISFHHGRGCKFISLSSSTLWLDIWSYQRCFKNL